MGQGWAAPARPAGDATTLDCREKMPKALPRRAEALTLEAINAFIHEYYVPDDLVMNRVAPE